MTEQRVNTKQALLAAIDQQWSALNSALTQLSPTTMTTAKDDHDWTVKDHLIHLYYWERGALYFLQGKPRSEGLEVTEQIYLSEDADVINEAIFQQQRSLPLDRALTQLRALQAELLAALEPLTDADLQKHYRHYLPEEPGDGDGPPAINVIYGNSAGHFAEHLAWIEALAAQTEPAE